MLNSRGKPPLKKQLTLRHRRIAQLEPSHTIIAIVMIIKSIEARTGPIYVQCHVEGVIMGT